ENPGNSDGLADDGHFSYPSGIAVDSSGAVYVADTGNNTIRKVGPDRMVSTVAGAAVVGSRDGTGSAARFNHPIGITLDERGIIYVADNRNSTIRKITP